MKGRWKAFVSGKARHGQDRNLASRAETSGELCKLMWTGRREDRGKADQPGRLDAVRKPDRLRSLGRRQWRAEDRTEFGRRHEQSYELLYLTETVSMLKQGNEHIPRFTIGRWRVY